MNSTTTGLIVLTYASEVRYLGSVLRAVLPEVHLVAASKKAAGALRPASEGDAPSDEKFSTGKVTLSILGTGW